MTFTGTTKTNETTGEYTHGAGEQHLGIPAPGRVDDFDAKGWILRRYAEDEAAVQEALDCSRILFAPCLDLCIIAQLASRIGLFLTADWTLGQEEICAALDGISELTPAGSGLRCLDQSKLLPRIGVYDQLPWLPDEVDHSTMLPTMATLELMNGVVRSRTRLLHIPSDPTRLYEALFSNRGTAPEILYLRKPDGLSWARWIQFADHRAELGQVVVGTENLPRFLCLGRRLPPWPGYEPDDTRGVRSAETIVFRRARHTLRCAHGA